MYFIQQKSVFLSLLALLFLVSACDIFNPSPCKTVGGIIYCPNNNTQVTQTGSQITFKPVNANEAYNFEITKGTSAQIPHFETNRFTIKGDSTYSQTETYGIVGGVKDFFMTTTWAFVGGRIQLNVAYPSGSNVVGTRIKYYRRTILPAGTSQYTLVDQKTFAGSSTKFFSNCLIGLPVTKTSADNELTEISLKSIGQNSYDKPIVIPPGSKMQNDQTCNLMVIMPIIDGASVVYSDLKAQKLSITLNKFKFFTLQSSEILPPTL